jgi:hypothetical protein
MENDDLAKVNETSLATNIGAVWYFRGKGFLD